MKNNVNSLRLSVSVGIPVYNEAANISGLLARIQKQAGKHFVLEQVIVISDGSTDKTVEIVKMAQKVYKNIVLIEDYKRMGKKTRLMQIYQNSKSDITITFDGDVMPSNKYVIEGIAKCFNQKNIVLVGGNKKPISSDTLMSKVIVVMTNMWYAVRRDIDHGNTILNIRGCTVGIRTMFAKSIIFPKDITSEALYLYLETKKRQLQFRFAEDSVIFYFVPGTFKDYLLQKKRAGNDTERLKNIYGRDLVVLPNISIRLKFLGFLYEFKKQPLLAILAMILLIVVPRIPRAIRRGSSEVWQIALSTKRTMSLNNNATLLKE